MAEITDVVVSQVAEAIQAAVSTLMLREGDELVLVGTYGVRAGVQSAFGRFPVADANPASEAARTGAAVVLGASDDIGGRYPSIASWMPPGRSLICLPLHAGGPAVGVIGLTFDEDWIPGTGELDFLTAFADSCAQAIRRVRATQQAAEQARRLTFMADASAELASSLDYRTTLSNVAALAVPSLADWCAVSMRGDGRDNGDAALTTLAVAHVDPAKVAWAWELEKRYPPDASAPTGTANVVRTGRSELYRDITDEMLVAAARDAEHLRLARELDLRSAITVALSARGRTLGAITLLRTRSSPPYDEADLAFAEDLGRRAGVAVDNALLYQQTEHVAAQLQRAVLPADLGDLPGWDVATHYRPGGQAEVGGDFFDAVQLDGGPLAIFIGDVMGHGIPAAAAMAQMRASIRALLCVDAEPSVVVATLDDMFRTLAMEGLVTLAYAVLDTESSQLRMVNAGHYPPLIVRSDGRTLFARTVSQRPLGAGGDDRAETTWLLERGDTLLLYTDGLIERRSETIDEGLARLGASGPVLAKSGLSTALDELIASVTVETLEDDVTAIAVRRRED
jgi:serine phosphatase RsbU (regulator of sigma subunit)